MSRRWRSSDLEQRAAAAMARRRALDEAHRRVNRGTATLPEYKLDFDELMAETSRTVYATLLVVRAAREARLVVPSPLACPVETVRTVLSYQPDEDLPSTLESALAKISESFDVRTSDPAGRAVSAQALLLLGPDRGKKRRELVWNSGLAADLARTTLADYEVWLIRQSLNWTPWIEEGRRLLIEEHGWDRSEAESQKVLVPLEAIALLIKDGFFNDR